MMRHLNVVWTVLIVIGIIFTLVVFVLGFHPYKEIVFLSQSTSRGLAYHLKSSTVQEIGNLYGYTQKVMDVNRYWNHLSPTHHVG